MLSVVCLVVCERERERAQCSVSGCSVSGCVCEPAQCSVSGCV